MARVELPVSRLRARRRKRRLYVFIFSLLAVCAFFGGLVALSWAPFLRIQQIDIHGVSSVNKDTVIQRARDSLSGAYWGMFARDNILLYPRAQVRAALLAQFPVFSSVSVSAEGLQVLRIDAVERTTHALWCGEGPDVSGSCLSLDESGAAYALAADFSGVVYTRYLGALATTTLPRQFLTPDKFRMLAALVEQFADKVSSTSVSVVAVNEGGEVRVECTNGFTLIFTLGSDAADVLQRFGLALTAAPFTTHSLDQVEYLDLRFGDKLYYKLRGSVETTQ